MAIILHTRRFAYAAGHMKIFFIKCHTAIISIQLKPLITSLHITTVKGIHLIPILAVLHINETLLKCSVFHEVEYQAKHHCQH